MHRTTLFAVVLSLVLVLGPSLGTVRAQDDDLHAKKLAAARKLMEVSYDGGFAKRSMDHLLRSFGRNLAQSPQLVARFDEVTGVEEVAARVAEVYAKHLDLEEMVAWTEFYESPHTRCQSSTPG